ncbi:GTPase ObgE [Dehalococcoidia bacterium]|nr:GTPase ObgE [Dehalococcoidia bacterium]
MIDEITIYLQAGNGGDGIVSFRREKYVPRGGPNGGDGGDGGSISVFGSKDESTLRNFGQKRKYSAENGKRGGPKNRIGAKGDDLRLAVPVGTIVWEKHPDASEEMLGEITEDLQELMVIKGGTGGRGNARFASSINQVPRLAEAGEPVEEIHVRLELKLLADAGLIGLPNAGKSTLLRAVSKARPEVGAYPFTTLEPHLGVVQVGWRDVVLADLPGLIEGAHEGKGLGHQFLRHIERTAVLVHLVDGSEEDPLEMWRSINTELIEYNEELIKKPQIVAVTKTDISGVINKEQALKDAFMQEGVEPFFISSLSGDGIQSLVERVAQVVTEKRQTEQKMAVQQRIEPPRVYVVEPTIAIQKQGDVFVVRNDRAERLATVIDINHPEARAQFQGELERLGIMNELAKKGAEPGDMVRIGRLELEWT